MTKKKIIGLGGDGTLLLKGPDGREERVLPLCAQPLGTVYLLIDCSESMAGEKLNQARSGAGDFILRALAKGYGAGLISFDDHALVLVPRSLNYHDFEGPLASLDAGGTTNLTQALSLALLALLNIEGPRFVVVVSDGTPDVPDSALAAAQKLAAAGVQLITIATQDADTTFLAGIATARDLAVIVRPDQLKLGIANTVLALPLIRG